MNKKCASGIVMACLLLAAQGSIFAEEPAPPDQNAPRRILVALEKTWLTGYSSEDMAILQRSLLTAISAAQGGPSPVAYGLSKVFPGSTKDRNKVARDAGADCWLWVKISGFGFAPSIRVLSYDLIYDIGTLDFTTSRHESFPMMNISREHWDDIVSPVAKKYPALDPLAYSRGPPAPLTLTLRAHPGTADHRPVRQAAHRGSRRDGRGRASLAGALFSARNPGGLRADSNGILPERAD